MTEQDELYQMTLKNIEELKKVQLANVELLKFTKNGVKFTKNVIKNVHQIKIQKNNEIFSPLHQLSYNLICYK